MSTSQELSDKQDGQLDEFVIFIANNLQDTTVDQMAGILRMTAFTHREVLRILTKIASRLTDQPQVLQALLASCSDTFPGIDLRVVHCSDGEVLTKVGPTILERNLHDIDVLTVGPGQLYECVRLARTLGYQDKAKKMMDALLLRSGNCDKALSQVISLAYEYRREGKGAEAEQLWQRIFSARPGDTELRKKYAAYMKRKEEVIPAFSQRPATANDRPDFESLKALVDDGRLREMITVCKSSLERDTSGGMLAHWINFTYRFAREECAAVANEVWRVILDRAPSHASSFLRFSHTYNASERNTDTDALIRRARALNQKENGRYSSKGLGYHPKDRETMRHVLERRLEIQGQHQTVQQWLVSADTRVRERQYGRAKDIWIALLDQEPNAMPSVSRGYIQLANGLSDEQCMKEFHIRETLETRPRLNQLFISVARQTRPALGERVLREVRATLNDYDSALKLFHILVKKEDYIGATKMWLPLDAAHARECEECASILLNKYNQKAFAGLLYAQVARTLPGCGKFAVSVSHDVLKILKSLLPTGCEKSLEPCDMFMLDFFMRHDAESAIKIIQSLQKSGAINTRDAEMLRSPLPS